MWRLASQLPFALLIKPNIMIRYSASFSFLVCCIVLFLSGCSAQKGTSPQDPGEKTTSINGELAQDCIDPAKIQKDKPCTKEYKPVCGCNEVTYANQCMAEKAGVTRWTYGKCEDLKPGQRVSGGYIVMLDPGEFKPYEMTDADQAGSREEQGQAAEAYAKKLDKRIRAFAKEKLSLTDSEIHAVYTAVTVGFAVRLSADRAKGFEEKARKLKEVIDVLPDEVIGIDK